MRAIFFDLDGTLVGLPDDFADLFESALQEHGVSANSEHHECYTDAFFDYLGECHAEPYRAAMADLRAEFDLEPSAEALAESYIRREAAATTLGPGVREALDELAAPDAANPDTVLGVLTNGGARCQHRKLEHHGIADYFDAVVVSGTVGAGKPDPEMFAAAKDAVPADQYVFVADDLERDVLPAQEAGFTGIHLADESGSDDDRAVEPDDARTGETDDDRADDERADETVSSLREVPDVLDSEPVG